MDNDIRNDFNKLVSRFNGQEYLSRKNLLRQKDINEDLIEQALAKDILSIHHEDEYDIYYELGSLGKQLLK